MIVLKNKKALILRPRDPAKITTVIPSAKVFIHKGLQYVAVPHRVDETKVLRNLGYDAPSPIMHHYVWPGRYTPFRAQLETAGFLSMLNRAFCLNDLGSGKSLATLWAYDYLRSAGKLRSALVISPLSTLERTWADEVFQHFPHLNYAVLHGSKAKRLALLANKADVYIVNHDGVEIIADALKYRDDIDLVVIDEVSQVARNANTDRWKALNTVVNKQVPRTAWGLTGTPTPNGPVDAWAQCRLLVPENVPPFLGRFKDLVMKQLGPYLWVPRPNATETVKGVMQPAIRFSRDECVDLPPVMYETREVELTGEQTKAYKQMLNTMRAQAENGEILAVNEAVKMSKLVQIVCGVAYNTDGEEVVIPSKHRTDEVRSIIETAAGKIIVFVPFVSAAKMLLQEVRKYATAELIHGGVSKGERDRIFTAFQKGKDLRVLVAQPAAMSHGLTLTEANTIVWYAPTTSNETFEQANGRITRPGQKNNQFIIMLEGSDVERKIYTRLRNKQKLQGLLLDEVKLGRERIST